MTGARTAYALPEAEGLEVDFLSEAGVEAQFEFLGKTLLAEAGPLAGKTLEILFHRQLRGRLSKLDRHSARKIPALSRL
jgi:hypothetical protein